MADIDISQLRNVQSKVIRGAEKLYSRVENPLGDRYGNDGSFGQIFTKAVDNIAFIDMTTATKDLYESYGSYDKCYAALFDKGGETDNTHDLSIALQKAQTALQYTVAVRDRIVQAYRDIMNMQI